MEVFYSGKNTKWLMISTNLVFLATGITLLIFGCVVVTHTSRYEVLFSAPILLVTAGTIFYIISYIGFYGLISGNSYHILMAPFARENKLASKMSMLLLTCNLVQSIVAFCSLLNTLYGTRIFYVEQFCVFLGIIFVILVSAAIVAIVVLTKLDSIVPPVLNDALRGYNDSNENTESVNFLQKKFSCCGVNSYQDWKTEHLLPENVVVPQSCCYYVTSCNTSEATILSCEISSEADQSCPIFTRGCDKEVEKYLHNHLAGTAAIAIVFAAILVAEFVFFYRLIKRTRPGSAGSVRGVPIANHLY